MFALVAMASVFLAKRRASALPREIGQSLGEGKLRQKRTLEEMDSKKPMR
jgi:hypothetical protein